MQRPYPPPSPDELLAVLAQRQDAVRSMNARVRATSWLGGDRVRATVNMLVDRRGAFRFEAEVSLQGTVAVLATHGGEFRFLDVQKNLLRRGPACPDNVASLIRIPLDTREVASVLLGDGGLRGDGAAGGSATVSWDAALGADVLAAQGRAVSFRKHDGAWDVVAYEGPSPKGRFKVLYEDMEAVEVPGPADRAVGAAASGVTRVRLPRVTRFAEDGRSFDDGVEIRFKDRTLNEDMPSARFEIVTPAGAAVENVGCGG